MHCRILPSGGERQDGFWDSRIECPSAAHLISCTPRISSRLAEYGFHQTEMMNNIMTYRFAISESVDHISVIVSVSIGCSQIHLLGVHVLQFFWSSLSHEDLITGWEKSCIIRAFHLGDRSIHCSRSHISSEFGSAHCQEA